MNVGASKPSDFGLYFQWGDTSGYTAEQVGKDKQFSRDDYKWNPSGDGETFTKYNETDKKTVLDLEDDAANANMGGDWHMPTDEQIQELIDETTHPWTTQDGVNGRLFTSKKDNSKFIFIPASGHAWNGSVINKWEAYYVWSSMLSSGDVSGGQWLYSDSLSTRLKEGSSNRSAGFTVRGVIG